MELRTKARELRWKEDRNYTRDELVILARVAGIQYIGGLKKHDIALKLGIELPNA